MLGDLQRTPSVDSLDDFDGTEPGLLEEDSITSLERPRRHSLYKYTAKKKQPAAAELSAYDPRFDSRDDLIDAALRTLGSGSPSIAYDQNVGTAPQGTAPQGTQQGTAQQARRLYPELY